MGAGEVASAVGEGCAVIELRHAVAAIERRPRYLDALAAACGTIAGARGGACVGRAIDAAVVADERDLIAVAVVPRMEGDRMLIDVRVRGRVCAPPGRRPQLRPPSSERNQSTPAAQ